MSSSESSHVEITPPENDRYAIEEHVGGDGSCVWKALDLKNDRTVALKRVRSDLAASRELMSRVKRDVKVFGKLKHDGLVQVFELDQDEHGPLLVLEWVDGQSLAENTGTTGPLSEQRAIKVIAEVADALHAAHQKKVTHRNIKPSNILIAADGTAKLTDFGLRRVDVESVLETPGDTDAIAPELLANPRDASVHGDIWSLGATLYQLLTGWSVRGFEASLIPDAHRDVLLCALADDPADRFSNAAAFAAALRGDRSELDSRELRTPEQFRIETAESDSGSESPESATPGDSNRTRVRFGKPAKAAPADGAVGEDESRQKRPKKRTGERRPTAADIADAEEGATSGRVTKARTPIKPEDEAATETNTPAVQVDEPDEGQLKSGGRIRVRLGRPTRGDDPDAEDGATDGRVTRSRRPLKPGEESAEDSEQPTETADGSETPEKKSGRGMRVRLGRPTRGDDPDAEDGAADGRVTRSRRPMKPGEESAGDGEHSAKEADAPQSKSRRGMRVRFGRSGSVDSDTEDGAAAGRVTRSRRPLKENEEAAGDQSADSTPETEAQADEPESRSGGRTRVRLGRRDRDDDAATEADGTTSGGSKTRRHSTPDETLQADADAEPAEAPVRRRPKPGKESDEPVRRRQTARPESATDDDSYDDDSRVETPRRRRKSQPEETDVASRGRRSADAAEDDESFDEPAVETKARRRKSRDSDQHGRKAAAASQTRVVGEDDEGEEAGRSQQTKKASNSLIMLWGGALVVSLAVVVAMNFPGGGSSGDNQPLNLNPGGNTTAPIGEATDVGEEFAGTEIQIGPNGQFKSIAPCLDYLRRNAGRYSTTSRGKNVELIVSGGKQYGPIVIDNASGEYPDGIHILAAPGARPVLTAKEGAVVQLRNVKSFRLDGFDIEAKSDVAMRIRGDVVGTRLVDLSVSGFEECGLELKDATGEVADEFVIRLVQFTPGRREEGDEDDDDASRDSVGIRMLAEGDAITSRTHISECQFNGPMKTGIALSGGCEFVELRQNIIDQAEVGIGMTGESVDWKELLIANTTFFECSQAGIQFSHMPARGGVRGTQLVICRNAFARVDGPELRVASAFDTDRFVELISSVEGAGIYDNWSDRQVQPDSSAGEVEIIELQQAGARTQRVEAIEFHTTDRERPDFLMLPQTTPLYIGGTGILGMQSWVGARPPIVN